MILRGTFFIALAAFAHSSGSPKRFRNQVHVPAGPASTSGRKFGEVAGSADIQGNENYVCSGIGEINDYGIFYEENGTYYPVQRGIPLLEHRGFVIGRPKNGLVVPIFNNKRKPVMADQDMYNLQHLISKEEYRKFHFFERIPPHYRVVNPIEPDEPEPEVEVASYLSEVRVRSSASAKKSGKQGRKKNRASM